jgi:methyl-accepting chemotaxis protein
MALKTKKEVEELADSLTRSADTIHKQLLKEIKKASVDQAQAQMIFQDEVVLRQKANGLYIDAANCVIKNLSEVQDDVVALIGAANEKLKKIEDIEKFIDLIADLLVLAAAAYAAKPGPMLAALKEVRKDLKA